MIDCLDGYQQILAINWVGLIQSKNYFFKCEKYNEHSENMKQFGSQIILWISLGQFELETGIAMVAITASVYGEALFFWILGLNI